MEELNEQLQKAKEHFEFHNDKALYREEVNQVLTANGVSWQWPTWPAV